VVVVLVLVAAGVGVYYFVSSKKNAPVKESALSGVLLTNADVGKAFNTGPFVAWPQDILASPIHGDDIVTTFSDPGPPAVDGRCSEILADDKAEHDGSGWNAVRSQYLQAPDTGSNANDQGLTDIQLIQSVVAFPDGATAKRFITSTNNAWQHCANRDVNNRASDKPDDPDDIWHNGAVNDRDSILLWPSSSHDDKQWMNTQGLARQANVVIEVCVQGSKLSDSTVEALVKQIRENVDKAPRQD
jgi:hypothetical protein